MSNRAHHNNIVPGGRGGTMMAVENDTKTMLDVLLREKASEASLR